MPSDIPSFPYYLGTLIRAIAHYIREGFSRLASINLIGPAYQFFSNEQKEQASLIAEQLVEISNRYEDLQPDEPLYNILEGGTPPADDTYINFKVQFTETGDPEPDDIGEWRMVQWRGQWSQTRSQIEESVNDLIDEMIDFGTSPIAGEPIPSRMILGSLIWFQHPQQG